MEVLCLLYYPLICCCCKFFLLVVIVIFDLKYNLKSLPLGGEGGGLLSSDNVRSTSPVSDFLSDNVRSTSHSKDSERRLQAGARFNLSSAKLQTIICNLVAKRIFFWKYRKMMMCNKNIYKR